MANAIGFEDLVAIEDLNFMNCLATGERYTPGFKEAVDVVSVQKRSSTRGSRANGSQ